jgi:hypothetical protein
MRKREWLTLGIFAASTLLTGLIISRAWNALWNLWYANQDHSWLWTILNWSIGRVAMSYGTWGQVNWATMIFMGAAGYGIHQLFFLIRKGCSSTPPIHTP